MKDRHGEVGVETVPVVIYKKVEGLDVAPSNHPDHKALREPKLVCCGEIVTILKHIISYKTLFIRTFAPPNRGRERFPAEE